MYCGHSFQKWRKGTALVSQLSGKNCTIYSSLFTWWNQNSYRKTANVAVGATKWRSLTKCVCFVALVELKCFMRSHYQKFLFVELTIFLSSPPNFVNFPFEKYTVLYCIVSHLASWKWQNHCLSAIRSAHVHVLYMIFPFFQP